MTDEPAPGRSATDRSDRRNEAMIVVAGVAFLALLAVLVHVVGIAAAIAVLVLVIVLGLIARMQADVTAALIVLVLVLLLFPARLRIAPLHAAGTPGSLIGMAAFAAWAYGRILRRPWLAKGPQPLRWAVLILTISVLASYLAMGFRPHDVAETKAADRGIMTLISMAGIMLLAADGIPNRARLRKLLEAVVMGGVVVASLGMIQFYTGQDLASRIHVPGFTFIASDYMSARSGFSRIVSTTSHPIEFSVVLVLTLCVALHLIFTSPKGARSRWIFCACVVAATIPMTVSRTGVIGLLAALIVLFLAWSGRRRMHMALVIVLGIVAMRLAVPGLIGTLRALFFNSSNDPSRKSRTSGYDIAVTLINQRPLFGRGFGTFLPQNYTYLDDQILLSVVETGVIGLIAVLILFGTGGFATREVRRLSRREDDRDLAQTLLACMVVGLTTAFTYDEFSFPTSRTLLMLLIGCAGALLRIARRDLAETEVVAAPIVPDSQPHWASMRYRGTSS